MANTKLVPSQWQNSTYMETITTTMNTVSSTSEVLVDSTDESIPPRGLAKRPASYSKRNNKRQFSYSMGLSRLGIFWTLQMGLDMTWGNSGFSITPSLHVQQLVKNTSPGFHLFYKSHVHQSDSESFCKGVIGALPRRNSPSPWYVFPDGLN